jgi:cell division protein FtsB
MIQQRSSGSRATGGPGSRGSWARAGGDTPGGTGRGSDRSRTLASTRPAARRTAGGKGTGGVQRTRASDGAGLTTRAAVLATIMLGLLLAYAYPVRVYLAQQAQIANIESQQAQQRRKIAALTEQRTKWDDPEYVKTQARRRLQYILPGETPMVVIGVPQESQPTDSTQTAAVKQRSSWYGKLWSSVEAADRK